jgi:hypothetical protein
MQAFGACGPQAACMRLAMLFIVSDRQGIGAAHSTRCAWFHIELCTAYIPIRDVPAAVSAEGTQQW